MGKSTYTAAVATAICERLSKGIPLAEICRAAGMPGLRTVYDWAEADEKFAARIARAREEGEEAIAAECLRILDAEPRLKETKFGDEVDSGDVALRRARVEGRLKLLAKWNPRRWGEKVELEHAGSIAHTIVTGVPGPAKDEEE